MQKENLEREEINDGCLEIRDQEVQLRVESQTRIDEIIRWKNARRAKNKIGWRIGKILNLIWPRGRWLPWFSSCNTVKKEIINVFQARKVNLIIFSFLEDHHYQK